MTRQQYRDHADRQGNTDEVEGIVVRHDHGLLMHDLADSSQRRLLAPQLLGQRSQAFGYCRVVGYDGFSQVVEVNLAAAVQQGGEQGDADGAAEVAQDVEQAGGGAGILRLDVGGGDQRDGHHDHWLAERANDLDRVELIAAEVGIERTGGKAGYAKEGEPRCAEQLRRDDLHQLGHQRNQEQLRNAHPHDHLADLQRVVVLNLRQVQRQQIDRSVKPESHAQAGDAGQAEVALAQNAEVDQRVGAR